MAALKKLFILMGLLTGFQAFGIDVKELSNTDLIDLSTNQSALWVGLQYPGPAVSGLCGLEIRADSYHRVVPIKNLLDALSIYDDVSVGYPLISVKGATTVSIDLSNAAGDTLTHIMIKTKDGSSLADTIRSTLGTSRKVVMVGTSCP